MAKLISLSARPGPFKKTVDIPVPGGTDKIEFTFKYRTADELAEFNDQQFEDSRARAADAVAKATPADGGDGAVPVLRLAEATREMTAAGAQYLLDVAEGWDLVEPFALENARELLNRYPGALRAVADTYNAELKGLRLGN